MILPFDVLWSRSEPLKATGPIAILVLGHRWPLDYRLHEKLAAMNDDRAFGLTLRVLRATITHNE